MDSLGGKSTIPYAINNKGQVAGFSETSSGKEHAFVTGPSGAGITDLGTLGGKQSSANDINGQGQVVGWSYDVDGVSRAFITTADGLGLLDLRQLGNNHGLTGRAVAYGVSEQGHVVGYAHTNRNAGYLGCAGFVTGKNGVGMRNLNDLVTLPDGRKVCAAKAINERGQILVENDADEGPLWILTPTRPTWKEELEAD